jgi:hypothetical protein
VVEENGPAILELCLMKNVDSLQSRKTYTSHEEIEDDLNSVDKSDASEASQNSDRTDWFIGGKKVLENLDAMLEAEESSIAEKERGIREREQQKALESSKSEDNLYKMGVEAPFELDGESSDDESESGATSSSGSSIEVEDDSSAEGSSASDKSSIYDLFPADSFSSLIKCHDGMPVVEEGDVVLDFADKYVTCVDRADKNVAKKQSQRQHHRHRPRPQSRRGRSLVRAATVSEVKLNRERRGLRSMPVFRSKNSLSSTMMSNTKKPFKFNDPKAIAAAMHSHDQDSIMSCSRFKEPVRRVMEVLGHDRVYTIGSRPQVVLHYFTSFLLVIFLLLVQKKRSFSEKLIEAILLL